MLTSFASTWRAWSCYCQLISKSTWEHDAMSPSQRSIIWNGGARCRVSEPINASCDKRSSCHQSTIFLADDTAGGVMSLLSSVTPKIRKFLHLLWQPTRNFYKYSKESARTKDTRTTTSWQWNPSCTSSARSVPQVEVTFYIVANHILNVSADKTTGKSNRITHH